MKVAWETRKILDAPDMKVSKCKWVGGCALSSILLIALACSQRLFLFHLSVYLSACLSACLPACLLTTLDFMHSCAHPYPPSAL